MSIETNSNQHHFEGTPRIALDEGARKQVDRSIEEARSQFHAAVENLIRTEQGENTVTGGSAHIASFGGTSKHNVFSAARDIIGSLVGTGQSQTLATSKPGRGR